MPETDYFMNTIDENFCGPTAYKLCPACSNTKQIELFQRQPSGKYCRHSYCKDCYNAKCRAYRVRNYSTEQKLKWARKSRYGITLEQTNSMLNEQGGRCAICDKAIEKFTVDHCHNTGRVRGLLCHACNIKLGGWDDLRWRESAMRYLGIAA